MSEQQQSEGQPGRLKRKLGLLQSAALLFAGVGASGGVFSLWNLSYGTSGPAFVWAYPLVGAGVFLICLVWAELASHYPVAGTFFEWPRLLMGHRRAAEPTAWWIGWLYLFGLTVTLTSIYIAIANAAIALFGWQSTPRLQIILALIALAACFAVNVSGIDRVGKLGVLGVIGELIAVGIIITLTLILGAKQSPAVFFDTGGQSFSVWLPGFIGAGIFMPIWALYTFEGAGLLGEETKEASRTAPKAILVCLGTTVVVAMYIIIAFILTTENPVEAMSATNLIEENINRVLPDWSSKFFEAVVVEILFLSASAILTYSSRQLYGMARAGELPFDKYLTKTLPNGAPWASLLVVGVIGGLPLFISSDIAVLVGGTVAVIYVAYTLLLAIVIVSRHGGWPHHSAPFSLGRYGYAISIGALVVSLAIGVDLLWPRDSTNPLWHGLRASYWMVSVPIVIGLLLRFGRRFSQRSVVVDPVDEVINEP